ncbi:MAG: ParB/RepB/Spo0J family partition protein [Oscillospiraceae bacterium]|nr:ParB/RepB/Spo0J family partition protein [Anaerolineaceae bacterium]MBR0162430.1 ParB/RepB/Spo0J family partition protein [Oscillospiraceae bacterium]
MAKSNVSSLLTSVDDLFTTQAERDAASRETVVDIPLEEISDCPNHPFKVRMDEAMMEMADSIRRYGVLVPGMVRPKPEGGYEMVAGHRRRLASKLARKPTMPCLVRNLTDDEAIIIMVDSNLQRESLLPSEKAFAYKMKLEAMKRQGQRTDLTSAPLGPKLGSRSNDELAATSPDGKTQIQRYIRLTYLIAPLLDMVDEGKIAMRPAVELSYLPEKEQTTLHEMMELEDCTPSHAQAIKMRRFAEESKLSEDVILSIMQEEKPNQKEQFRMPRERISKYFPAGTPTQKIEDTIIKALELYQRQRNRGRER